jgi:DtxR family Mn-dependent transcriptional regulator
LEETLTDPAALSRPSQTIEDYLQLIYLLERDGEDVIAARLKERKGVSAPTVWATVKRLERDGLISIAQGHRIHLTEAGNELAESIIRRHMLAERLLTDILKLDWADVHDEAHRMEHAISPLIERQILRLLGNPTTCPHGNPLPGLVDEGRRRSLGLSHGQEGDSVVINNIVESAEDDAALMHYLERSRLVPGERLQIDEVSVPNATVKVTRQDDGVQVVVGMSVAELIMVRPVEAAVVNG